MGLKHVMRRAMLWALVLLWCAPRAGVGYVVLTKEGYSVEHKLLAQAGARIGENLTVHGLTISAPSAALRCNPSRKGALRWRDNPHDSLLEETVAEEHRDSSDGDRKGSFEACDGEGEWRPLSFCDLGCNMNLDKIPCGIPVLNRCNRACKQVGKGLNLRHCLFNIAKTPCGEPVTDNCNNICGFLGQVCLRRWRILRQRQSRVLRARCVDWHGDSRVLSFLAARLQPWYGCLNTGCACHQLVGLCQPGVIPAVSGHVGASLCVDDARRCTLSRLHEER